jgi:hypothetical protein
MKIKLFIIFLFAFNSSYAQMVSSIVHDACKDGAEMYSKIAKTNVIETYKIASETEPNSPERIRRLQILETQLDDTVGKIKLMNREHQEQWVKKGIRRDVASLRRQTLDASIFISISLAYENPRWDLTRLILETQEKCEASYSK